MQNRSLEFLSKDRLLSHGGSFGSPEKIWVRESEFQEEKFR
jgi:hypothetical protein